MRQKLTFWIFLVPFVLGAQNDDTWKKPAFILTPELMFGQTGESNEFFPQTDLQKQLMLNFGRNHDQNPQEWAYWLKNIQTGVGLGYTDFGNRDSLGIALTAIPYIEFNGFRQKRFTILVGMGATYFTEIWDPETNPKNRAVSTEITWAFRTYFYYRLFQTKKIDWRLGVGYSHHSNGHTRLPNQGYNSFLASLSGAIKFSDEKITELPVAFDPSVHHYISVRSGFGINTLTDALNDKKNVYTLAGEYGRVLNNSFRLGIGFSYRMYEHYYDYIKNNEALVQDGKEFEYFKEQPWRYATNFGLTVNGEFLLNHIGIDLQLGYNFHKPAYKIDWRLNQGWDNVPREIPDYFVLGEFDSKFKLKQQISSRLGFKYYLIGTSKAPAHNLFLGAHLNANLGQADFSELSLGYVYSYHYKKR